LFLRKPCSWRAVAVKRPNWPIRVSKLSLAALAARAHWLTVEWLPKYAPELNDIEAVWRDLKAHYLAHQTFTDVSDLDQAFHNAVHDLNQVRMSVPLAKTANLCRENSMGGVGVMRLGHTFEVRHHFHP
jgi:hypothetical protein